jgi:PmbA protein
VSKVREIIKKAKAKGASSCEVFYLNSLTTSVDFEAGRLKGVSRTEERGATLRLVKGGRLGLATTTKLDETGRLVEDALATAAYGEKTEFDFAGDRALPEISTATPGVQNLVIDDAIVRLGEEIRELLEYESKINTEAGVMSNVQEIGVATSEGRENTFTRTLYRHHLGGRLVEEGNMLDASDCFCGTTLDTSDSSMPDRVIGDFKNGRKNVEVSTGPTTVLFTPRAVTDIMLTLNQGVSGAIVDRKISPLTGKIGETIFDERITIHDDGLIQDGYNSAPFDDEGTPMQTTPIVEGGVLKSFLTDLRTSRKLGLPQTGNGIKAKRLFQTKDLGKVPAPEITNWVMAGGEKPHAELVAGMKEGVIVDSIMGILMSNLIAGDFSGNIAYGLKIENGKLVGRVKDTMVSGNIYRLLRDSLLEVSSDVERTGLMGFIGSHWYPYLLVKDVSISTKA